MIRRMAAVLRAGFTGVVLAASFAMFRISMAISNAGIILLRPICRRKLSAIVEIQGEREEAVRCGGCEEEPAPYQMWASISV